MWLQVPVEDTDERKHRGVINYCVQQHGHQCLIFIRQSLCVCMCLCACIWIYTRIKPYVCIYVCVHMSVYIYIHIYMEKKHKALRCVYIYVRAL